MAVFHQYEPAQTALPWLVNIMTFKGSSSKHIIRTTANIAKRYVHTQRHRKTDYEMHAKNITDATMQDARDDIRNMSRITMALLRFLEISGPL